MASTKSFGMRLKSTRAQKSIQPTTTGKLFGGKDRRALFLVSILLIAIAFLQEPGKIVFDTKLAMATNPAKFMQEALHLWDPFGSFGEIQNQAYGYLFPIGPFYEFFHVLGVPAWITQRLWASLILVIGLWGAVRLGEVLDIGSDTTRLIGGLAFAVSPFVASLGSVTYGVLPNTFLPLCLIPLITASRGEQSVIRGVARSSLAVLAMGGVNASSVLMVLPVPFLWIMTRENGPRKWKMMRWWFAGTLMATMWWIIPLLFQGKFGFNFLPYTETASITNATTSATEVLRGAGYWLAYLDVNQPWLVGGWLVSTNAIVILATIVVAGVALFGLVRNDMKERVFLVGTLIIGVIVLCVGYAGPLHGVVNGFIDNLLNGVLAPLRNISKIEPMVSLVMALALMHALTIIKPSRYGGEYGKAVAIGRVVICVVIGAGPLLLGNFYPAGGFSSVPSYWSQAANWIGTHAGQTNTLYVPGTAFGQYSWGNPLDEPIWSLASSPWAIRSIIPLGSKGSTLLLTEIDRVLQDGEPVPGFAEYLARAGIKYIVVRNDINDTATGAPSPLTIENILGAEPGIKYVRSFGQYLRPSPNPKHGFSLGLRYLQTTLHDIDIFQVQLPVTMAAMYTTNSGVILSGGPGRSLLEAAGSGLINNEATSLAGDPHGPNFANPTWVDTDGNRDVDVDFGKISNQDSYVLQPGELSPNTGLSPHRMSVVSGVSHMTIGKIVGVSGITASSYGSPIQRLPGYQPAFAFANYPGYEWAATNPKAGSWIRVQFDSPVPLTHITITPDDSEPWRPHITQVQITTQGGSVLRNLVDKTEPQTLSVPSSFTSFLKIKITQQTQAKEQPGATGPAIEHISVPGITVLPTMELPSDELKKFSAPGANPASFLINSPTPDPTDFLSPPDGDPHIARIFDVPQKESLTISGEVTPLPTQSLIDVLSGGGEIKVSASSTFSSLPWYRPANLIDQNSTTDWISGINDKNPSVTMSWPSPETISTIEVDPTSFLPGVRQIRISSAQGSRIVDIPATGGEFSFPALTTTSVTLSFPGNAGRSAPIGFANIFFPQIENLAGFPPNPNGTFSMACGTAPPIVIDGVQYPTEISGTWGDLLHLLPLSISVCNEPGGIFLTPGSHLLTANDEAFPLKVTQLNLLGSLPPPIPVTRSVKIDSWSPETRVISVGAGTDQEILTIRQNYNIGWSAQLNGHPLTSVRVDGWQQGYLIPPGSGGTVQMSYGADSWYRLSLLFGLFLVFAIIGLALSPIHDPYGLPNLKAGKMPSGLFSVGAALVAIGLIGGPLVLVVPILIYLRWRKASLGRIAFITLMGAGIIDAIEPGKNPFAGPGPLIGLGPFSGPAQLLAVTAIASVLVAIIPDEMVNELARLMTPIWDKFRDRFTKMRE